MALVAVHAWDCHGAKKAGCLFLPADVTGDDLIEVVDQLLAL